jgi:hypothetical protein
MSCTQETYIQRPHVWDVSEQLYWGLVGYTDEHPGDLAHVTPIEIYDYVAAYLSIRLNRSAPIDEIAAVIAEAWKDVQNAHSAACVLGQRAAADKVCFPATLRLEEAWLLVDDETRASMPRESRVVPNHVPVYRLRLVR